MNIFNSAIKNQIIFISNEFKKRRIKLNYSQIKFSKESGLSQSIINKFENKKIDPSFSTILKYENTLERLEKLSKKKAKDIMIENVISVNYDSKIHIIMELMIENDYSQILISKDNKIIGVVYQNSILKLISNKIDIYDEIIENYIEELPIIVSQNISVSDLSLIFQNKKIKFILVGNLIEGILGIITKTDIYD